MLLLVLSSIASIASIKLHTCAALYTQQKFAVGTQAANKRYFFTQDNVDCLVACFNGYSPLLTTKSKLTFCWTVAVYLSHQSQCWCHNDTAEFPLSVSSAQPSLVLVQAAVREAVLLPCD